MELTRKQAQTGLLELLNAQFNLQDNNVVITDYTNIMRDIGLDSLDITMFLMNMQDLVDFSCSVSPLENQTIYEIFDAPFYEVVDNMYINGVTLRPQTEKIYFNDLPMNNTELMNNIAAVIKGRQEPKYTLYQCSQRREHSEIERNAEKKRLHARQLEAKRINLEHKKQLKHEQEILEHARLLKEQQEKQELVKQKKKKVIIFAAVVILAICGIVTKHHINKKIEYKNKSVSEKLKQKPNINNMTSNLLEYTR